MAKAKKAAKGKKGGPIKVDFTGVEGKRSNLPDDDYLVEIEEVEVKEGSEYPYFELTMVVQAGKFKGQKLWDRMSTSPGALWRLRSFLEVIGMEVPDDEMEIDKDELVGTQLVAVTAQEKYKNDDGDKKIAVRMVDFYTADDFKEKDDDSDEDEDDDEDDKKSKKKSKKDKKADKGKKSKKDDDSDDDDDADSDDDDSDSDDDEDETPEERKKRLRKERRAKRKKGGDDDDSDDDDDDKPAKKGKSKKSKDEDDDDGDEDDDDDKPAKKSKKGKKKKGGDKVSADTVNEADEDALGEIIEEHSLDVDLDDFKTLRKKQAAVIDALETAELLEDDE